MTPDLARARLGDPVYFAALMLHLGDADMMIGGAATHYAESMRTVLEIIGPAPGVRRIASLHMVLRPKETYFLADCAVNIEPDAEDLAEIALLSAGMVRSLGIEPRVAMLSFSNFGSVDHPLARKVRRAAAIARERAPGLVIDGEIQLETALDEATRAATSPSPSCRRTPTCSSSPTCSRATWPCTCCRSSGTPLPWDRCSWARGAPSTSCSTEARRRIW